MIVKNHWWFCHIEVKCVQQVFGGNYLQTMCSKCVGQGIMYIQCVCVCVFVYKIQVIVSRVTLWSALNVCAHLHAMLHLYVLTVCFILYKNFH